jgi:hypothetical protein
MKQQLKFGYMRKKINDIYGAVEQIFAVEGGIFSKVT